MKIKALLTRILQMYPPAMDALIGTLKLSCAVALCAFIILIDIGPVNTSNYYLYITAREMANVPAGLLLIAALGTVILEEQSRM